MIKIPNIVNKVAVHLNKFNFDTVIVGGYIRDQLLGFDSKDIDIEVYNVSSFNELKKSLSIFGDINEVGKKFGVLKLKIGELDLDFSLPRTERKVGLTHSEFEVTTHTKITFKEASKRRDFTINSMGYNIITKEFLDPFNGNADLQSKSLKYVNENTFKEDPLRILRAMQFCARFDFVCDSKLMDTCKTMVEDGELKHISKERIFLEFEKLFLKASKPSIGIEILRDMNGFDHFSELKTLSKSELNRSLKTLDELCSYKSDDKLFLMFTMLSYELKNIQLINSFLNHFVDGKKLYKKVSKNITFYKELNSLELLVNRPKPFIQGRDLIAVGMKPSEEFAVFLDKLYIKQLKGEFNTKEEAIKYLSSLQLSN
ncbi:MAG: hypothetical protein GQ570_04605 [Helicobacteraceae bacterium]|nr:hypothetical protein [Helicobacteraceae bacterium]